MDNPADDWDLYLDIRERYQPSGGMMDEFIRWATENVAPKRRYETLDLRIRHGEFISQDTKELYAVWLESARRADRQAREECAEICEQHEIYTALDCADFIRSTIQEKSV